MPYRWLREFVDTTAEPLVYRLALEAHDLVPSALHPGWPGEPVQASVRARGRGAHHRGRGRLGSASSLPPELSLPRGRSESARP